MASKAVGFFNGVAKGATLVSVKTTYDPSGIEHCFIKILDDISSKDRANRAVIVLPASFGNPNPIPSDPIWEQWRRNSLYIDLLIELGVPTVVTAGNNRDPENPLTWESTHLPALVQTLAPSTFPLVIVSGAVNLTGHRASFSQALPPNLGLSLWAPGERVACAGMANESDTVYKSGTSFSAPMVCLETMT